MTGKVKQSDFLLFLLAILAVLFFVYAYPRLYPYWAIRTEKSSEEILQSAGDFVESLGYDLEGTETAIRLEHNADQIQYLERVFGTKRANTLMTDSIPAFFWSVRWMNTRSSLDMSAGDSQDEQIAQVMGQLRGENRLLVDLKGRPIEFNITPSIGTNNDSVDVVGGAFTEFGNSPQKLADRLVAMYGGNWIFEKMSEESRGRGRVQKYSWEQQESPAGERSFLEIFVSDSKIISFQRQFTVPKPYTETGTSGNWMGIALTILVLIFFIIVVMTFIQRLRADLMDVKSGLLPAILVLLGWFVYMWVDVSAEAGGVFYEALIAFAITGPFVGGGVWLLFIVGESLTREVWSEKLSTVDSLRSSVFTPPFGLSLIRGVSLSCLALGISTLVSFVGIALFKGFFTLGDSTTLKAWTFRFPSLYVLGQGLLQSQYVILTFCFFLLALFRKRWKQSRWIGVIPILLWSFVPMAIPHVQPFGLRMSLNLVMGILFTFFFFRYEIVTVLTGAIGLPVVFYGISFIFTADSHFMLHGWILLSILSTAILVGLLALRGKASSTSVVPYVPDYLRRISERERIQRELEIARTVQLSFLPRQNPSIKGLDIASLCLPAREVGGDYYDFIEVDPDKLGVVIGDVSGKGIPAAFYMTLTKGLLKSQARTLISPRDILINLNELFYENAERGVFISMIYGIFDLKRQSLTFARAGHNPMILRRSGKGAPEELESAGLALGLEKGQLFSKTIEEKTIGIQKGDIFLFYTDGLNETQNVLRDEFGEDRLLHVVQTFGNLSAESVLAKIQQEIQSFADRAPQHDDMTAVVIKVG